MTRKGLIRRKTNQPINQPTNQPTNQSSRELYESYFRGKILVSAYTICQYWQILISWAIPNWSPFLPSHAYACVPFVPVCCNCLLCCCFKCFKGRHMYWDSSNFETNFLYGLQSDRKSRRTRSVEENVAISDRTAQNGFKHFKGVDFYLGIKLRNVGPSVVDYDDLKRKVKKNPTTSKYAIRIALNVKFKKNM